MPGQKLALEPGGDPRLELEWGGYMRQFTITLDGEPVGEIEGGQRELREGREFTLPDGSTLSVRLRQSMFLDELEVLRDGKPLPGSAVDPYNKYSFSISLTFFWGVISIIAGLLQLFDGGGDLLLRLGFSPYSAVAGVLLIGCSYLIYRRFALAPIAALLIYLADWFVAFSLAIGAGAQPNSLGILARVLIAVLFVQGIRAIRAVRRQTATS